MGTTIVNGIEVGPDGKTEWAKIAAGDEHMSSPAVIAKGFDGSSPIGGRVYHGHALREAFVAGAEWQEKRIPSVGIVKYQCWKPSGSGYSQYDIVVNGVVDTGWCEWCRRHRLV